MPIRERSYELLGDEKPSTRSAAAGCSPRKSVPGGLALRAPPAAHRLLVSQRRTATLLVENHTTAHTLARWLHPTGQVGTIIYSAGSQLPQILASLPEAHTGPLYYFGDVYLRGVEIAADGDLRTDELGLGPLCPAAGPYRLLLDIGTPMPAKSRLRSPSGPHVYAWLPDDTRHQTENIIAAEQRIPQEAVRTDILHEPHAATFDPLGAG